MWWKVAIPPGTLRIARALRAPIGEKMADTTNMRNLARETSELALRLASLSANGPLLDPQALSDVEQLASKIIQEVSKARGSGRSVGETSGMWRIVQPIRR